MNLRDVEENLAAIEVDHGSELLYELLRAYGLPKAAISRLRSGTYDKAEGPDEHLWKRKVYFRTTDSASDDLYGMIEEARSDERVIREVPRFLIVENGDRLLARDQQTAATLDIQPSELAANTAFFMPWAGVEKTQLENLSMADVKAAEKMAKLYDEVTRHNKIETEEQHHDLNVFFSRLLFCFFAEDTGVFESASFTNAVGSLTQESGSDTASFLDQLFEILDTEPSSRGGAPEHLRGFGYVNGKLFSRRSHAPHFTAKARSIALECGTLDWSQINPDIFGSMMQAVVQPSQREGLGMHYTSVENIMKVIRPLFLDDLEEQLAAANTVRKAERFIDRLTSIQVFDPACGSGNFLVISYKELRRLEHEALQRIAELEPRRAALFQFSRIDLENFYGIEIDDFAHEVATLSLWLAKHQMNREFHELFGVDIPLIPLVEAGNVVCDNAALADWQAVCLPASGKETFVCGNPPYLGARLQTPAQKRDFRGAPELADGTNDLDYVAIWLMKAATYLAGGHANAGLVATSSVCQGVQVALLWPSIFATGAEISYAVQPFRWSNQAKRNAGVSCVIVGLSADHRRDKWIYNEDRKVKAKAITPYLTSGRHQTVVRKSRNQLFGLPPLTFGSMPNDGGGLILSPAERDELVAEYPAAETLIKRFVGSNEFIKGKDRYVLWIPDDRLGQALEIPPIAARLGKVKNHRQRSKRSTTKELAKRPHRFGEIRHRDGPTIVVPATSSERREYIPIGFTGGSTVISNAGLAVYDAEPWLFGLIQSRMHMVWVRGVAGRLESRLRYSAILVYNTFPPPEISAEGRSTLTRGALGVLAAREEFSDRTLAELYDPDDMPRQIRTAHHNLDELVDTLYESSGFNSDELRLARLFDMYEQAIESEPASA